MVEVRGNPDGVAPQRDKYIMLPKLANDMGKASFVRHAFPLSFYPAVHLGVIGALFMRPHATNAASPARIRVGATMSNSPREM